LFCGRKITPAARFVKRARGRWLHQGVAVLDSTSTFAGRFASGNERVEVEDAK